MKVKVRFPNDDYHYDIDIDKLKDNFKVTSEFDKCLFGWWHDTHVELLKVQYTLCETAEDEAYPMAGGYANPLDIVDDTYNGFKIKLV
jgi:hypothetical protein